MKQQCYLANVWLTWVGVPVVAILIGLKTNWLGGFVVMAVGIVAQIVYVSWFPRLSRWVGYGSVADQPVRKTEATFASLTVTLYTASVCPLCPLVRKRLLDLKAGLGFQLREFDVTFRLDLILSKGLKAVPVVEANGRYKTGNATSGELLAFLNEAQNLQAREAGLARQFCKLQ
ncbi:glutaredoxin family protein [candidate division KSB1 bacterium]|nr:glutaredoxin family protein [candidate division KSB1 bacterium]